MSVAAQLPLRGVFVGRRFTREIWPKDAPKGDPTKLVECMEELVLAAKTDYKVAQKIVKLPEPDVILLQDMPGGVIDGRLREIYESRMERFSRAYAYPALLAVASVMVPRSPATRTNLYVALVGPVHSGKSQAIEHAVKLLGLEPPLLMDLLSGSAEALMRKVKDAGGSPRLFSPDELGHLLEKSAIERSSYSFMLNRAYYQDRFDVLMGKGKSATFDCALSIVGGLVDDRFQDLFGAATIGGLYDRFFFGQCPGGYIFDYFPFDGLPESTSPCVVTIDPEVWTLKSEWLAADRTLNARVVEHGIRVATICASFDGRQRLRAHDLGPAREFVRYQTNIRRLLQPNPGENPEGKLAHKFLEYLKRFDGKYVSRRTMLRDTRAYDLGPSTADRALAVLHANGDIAITDKGRQQLVRFVMDQDGSEEESE